MKIFGICLAASLAAACASHPAPEAVSSDSPAVAADTASHTADLPSTQAPQSASTLVPSNGSAANNAQPPAPMNNAIAATSNAASEARAPSQPDNSSLNSRDKGGNTLTPMDQGTSERDRKITQQIRQAVVKDGSLSFTAKNVKIITINGKVTLRGPVKSDQERSSIEAEAKKVAGDTQVENQLEVKK